MTATSGPGSFHVRSSSDFEPQKYQFRDPFLSDFKTCQNSENQAETAARTLSSAFGKVQNQAQNQVRNQEPSKMTRFAVRELHEALRVMPRCQRDSEKGPKIEAFGAFQDPTFCVSFQNAPRRPFDVLQVFPRSPGPSSWHQF